MWQVPTRPRHPHKNRVGLTTPNPINHQKVQLLTSLPLRTSTHHSWRVLNQEHSHPTKRTQSKSLRSKAPRRISMQSSRNLMLKSQILTVKTKSHFLNLRGTSRPHKTKTQLFQLTNEQNRRRRLSMTYLK